MRGKPLRKDYFAGVVIGIKLQCDGVPLGMPLSSAFLTLQEWHPSQEWQQGVQAGYQAAQAYDARAAALTTIQEVRRRKYGLA